jgi:dipeptidyl-peptidase-4
VRTVRITAGDAEPVTAPDGLQVRAVLGADDGRVWFTASQDPWETHVWSYAPAEGFRRLTDLPGEHTATAAGGTVVLDSRTPEGHTVTLLRESSGPPRAEDTAPTALPIAVTTHPFGITARPELLELGPDRLAARLHLPSWYRPGDDRLPVLLSPYGGPGMQVVTRAAGWPWAVCQWFAEQGYAVLAVDGRGTPGRGVAWQRAVWGDRIRPAVEDQVTGLRYAAKHCPALDTGRVAIRGWSYGGYLAAGAVLHRPDVFHAAVAGAAPADQTQYDTYWQERYLGHPEVTPETYRRSSLIPYAHRLRRPLLLVHGVEDDNVHVLHTLRLSAALLATGRRHSVLLATGRRHSVLPLAGTGHVNNRPGTADMLLWQELDFLRRSLGVRSEADGRQHGTERGQLPRQ